MTFRSATPADLPAIIDLLRISLGEGSTEKSTDFWRWKHERNPAGRSPVLVADDNGRIAGIRAFMRWTWQSRERDFRALRAVDTATHPDYRGKGIFKKLTLQLIEECVADGDDFIFNTPNEQSRPGYLKMGWQQLGKLPVRLQPARPLSILRQAVRPRERAPLTFGARDFSALADPERLHWLPTVMDKDGAHWWTPRSVDFLRWRYADCPARDYYLLGDPDRYLIFYYGRQQRIGNELRLVDYLVRPGEASAARAALRQLRRTLRPDVITCAPAPALPPTFLPALPLGLILTFRGLNLQETPPVGEWGYAIGDMELF